MEKEKINSDTKLAKADMDNATKIQIESMKQSGESGRQIVDVVAESEKEINKEIANAIKDEQDTNDKIEDMLKESEISVDRRKVI